MPQVEQSDIGLGEKNSMLQVVIRCLMPSIFCPRGSLGSSRINDLLVPFMGSIILSIAAGTIVSRTPEAMVVFGLIRLLGATFCIVILSETRYFCLNTAKKECSFRTFLYDLKFARRGGVWVPFMGIISATATLTIKYDS